MEEHLIRRAPQRAKVPGWMGVLVSLATMLGLLLSVPVTALADAPARFSRPIGGDYFFSDTTNNVPSLGPSR